MFRRKPTDPFSGADYSHERVDLYHPKSGQDKLKAIGLACFLFIVSGFFAYHTIAQSAESLDADLCLSDQPTHTTVAVLIDTTDPPSIPQRRTLETSLHHHVNTLEVGTRFSIYLLTPDGTATVVTPIFSKCKPKSGANAHWLTDTKTRLEQRYREKFQVPFKAALARLDDARPANSTPLLEAVSAIIKEPVFSRAKHRQLELWSDMLQNSPSGMTHFKAGYSMADLQQRHSHYLTSMRELAGADVYIHQFKSQQYGHLQTTAHEQFWQELFRALGVRHIEQTRL